VWPGFRSPSFIGMLQAAAAITVVFSIATLANSLHRFLELFSHFRLQYLVVAFVIAAIFAALRHRRWAMLMLAVTVVNTIPVAPWYLDGADRPVEFDEKIHILFANVKSGNAKTQTMLRLIESENPDLIVLQEITETWATAMTTVKYGYPYHHIIPRHDNFGIAVYSRQPLLSVDVLSSPPLDLPSLLVQQRVGDTTVSYVTTHPIPPLGKSGFDARNEQLADIGVRVAALDGPAVLIGDLNTAVWGHHYKKLIADTGLTNASVGFGIIPTWPRQLPFAMIPIDQCLVTDDFAVLDIRSGPAIGSDHLPLIVTLGLL